MQTAIDTLAQNFNLDRDSVASLIAYLRSAINKPGGEAALLENPDLFIETGFAHWHKARGDFLQSLIDNKTPEAKMWRAKMADSVWNHVNGVTA